MQLITEAYDILKRGFGMTEAEIAAGELPSDCRCDVSRELTRRD